MSHARPVPADQVVSLPHDHLAPVALRVRRGPDKQVDEVLPALIDERGHGPVAYVVEAATDQWKPLRAQIYNRRRKVEFAFKPRLDRVLIG